MKTGCPKIQIKVETESIFQYVRVRIDLKSYVPLVACNTSSHIKVKDLTVNYMLINITVDNTYSQSNSFLETPQVLSLNLKKQNNQSHFNFITSRGRTFPRWPLITTYLADACYFKT